MDEYESVPFWEWEWSNPDQAQPEQQPWYDWEAPLDTEGFRYAETTPIQQPMSPTTPSLNIPWREQPTALVGTDVIQPYTYTTDKTWFDKLGDVFADVAPTLLNIYSSSLNKQPSASSYTILPSTKTAGSGEVTKLAAQGGVTGTTSPSLGGVGPNVLLIGGALILLLLLTKRR